MRHHSRHLRDVAERWVAVSKIPNLSVAEAVETVVALAQVTLFVFPLAVCDTYE